MQSSSQATSSTKLSDTNEKNSLHEISSDGELRFDENPGPSDKDDRKVKLLSIAPKLPFDVDLYHWEDENLEAPTRLT